MKQIFTQSACLFWALLLAAVFSSETAVGQNVVSQVEYKTTEANLVFKMLNTSTKYFRIETQNQNQTDGTGYIEADPGLGNGTYSGLFYVNVNIPLKKGSYYTVEVEAGAYAKTGIGNQSTNSKGTLTFVKGTSETELISASGQALIGAHTVDRKQFTRFTSYIKTDDFVSETQYVKIGFRLDGLGSSQNANKAVLEFDNFIIKEYSCEGTVAAPIVGTTNFERCGTGLITLTSTNSNPEVISRWFDSSGNAVHTGNDYQLTHTDYESKIFTVRGYNTLTGCLSSVGVTITSRAIRYTNVTGNITSSPIQSEVGVETTYSIESNIINNNHVASIQWFIVKGEARVPIGRDGETSVKYTPITNEPFEVECEIAALSGTCYTESPKLFSTQTITPLPVEIIYFTAAKQGNNVLLEWATASEENNTGFEVQVSQDGFNFRKLDFVPTKNGNTVIKQVYTFKDTENGKYGTRYYRLKQIDMDGQYEYFTTKAVSFGEVSNYSLKAFPNPFEGEVNLELNADESGKLNVQVLDAMGRSVMTQQFEVSKGRSLEKITLWQSLPKGIYFVRTEMNGQANNFKLLKK